MRLFFKKLRARKHQDSDRGFTIIELVAVIAFLGVLTALAIPSYSAVVGHARFKSIVSNMNTTVQYVELYKAKNGYYPKLDGWSFQGNSPTAAQRNAYIPGLVPTITTELPMTDDKNGSFLYASNGTDYKIIRYAANGIKPAEWSQVPDSMKDYFGKANLDRYGYWSPGGAGF